MEHRSALADLTLMQSEPAVGEGPHPSLLTSEVLRPFTEFARVAARVREAGDFPIDDVMMECVLAYALRVPVAAGQTADRRLMIPPIGVDFVVPSLLAASLRILFSPRVVHETFSPHRPKPTSTVTILTSEHGLETWGRACVRVVAALVAVFPGLHASVSRDEQVLAVYKPDWISFVVCADAVRSKPHTFVFDVNHETREPHSPIVIVDNVASWEHYQEYFERHSHHLISLLGVDWTLPPTQKATHVAPVMTGRTAILQKTACVIDPWRLVVPRPHYKRMRTHDCRVAMRFEFVVNTLKFPDGRRATDAATKRSVAALNFFVKNTLKDVCVPRDCVGETHVNVKRLVERFKHNTTLVERLDRTTCMSCEGDDVQLSLCCGRADFCYKCQLEWLKINRTCAMCRKPFCMEADALALAFHKADNARLGTANDMSLTMRNVLAVSQANGVVWSTDVQIYAQMKAFNDIARERGTGFRVVFVMLSDNHAQQTVDHLSLLGFMAMFVDSDCKKMLDTQLTRFMAPSDQCVSVCTSFREGSDILPWDPWNVSIDGDILPWNLRRVAIDAVVCIGSISHTTPLLKAASRAVLRSAFCFPTLPPPVLIAINNVMR